MKKMFIFLLIGVGLGWAWISAAEPSPKEVLDKTHLEGWILKVDYNNSRFYLMDSRGFQIPIKTKPGIIGDCRLGDHVKVAINPDYQRADVIEKI